MNIRVSTGTGSGPTEISAFDQALVNAGVANFNLIYLSSVLPPSSEIHPTDKPIKPEGEWGDRLYVVMAQNRTIQRHQEVWAGIGWIQDPVTKKGLLVEHEGHSEAEVRADITSSLDALAKNRGTEFGPVNMQVSGIKCEGKPVCALVVAVFENSGWRNAESPSGVLKRLAGRASKKQK